jgi:O-methyltransferase
MTPKKLEALVAGAFDRIGLSLSRKTSPEMVERGQEFASLVKAIGRRSVIDEQCLLILWQFANSALALEGDAAEMGVYKGGSARLLAKAFGNDAKKSVFLFDTFSGMPAPDPTRDLNRKGDFSDTSLESVKEFLKDCPNVVLYKGLFSETLSHVAGKTFCFVHIDCDIYQSVRECCEFLYPRMTRGGYMIFDDYVHIPGVKRAIDEFFSDKTERPVLIPRSQCLIIKR